MMIKVREQQGMFYVTHIDGKAVCKGVLTEEDICEFFTDTEPDKGRC